MKINSLTIKNLRGIKFLSCEKLSPITLIGGCNNCGKSTFLEAIRLLSARKDASAAPDINLMMRQINLRGKEELQILFNNPETPITISSHMDGNVTCSVKMFMEKQNGGDWSKTSQAEATALPSSNWILSQESEDFLGDKLIGEWHNSFKPNINDKGQIRFSYTSSHADSASTDWKCLLLPANTRSSSFGNEIFGKMTVALQDRALSTIIHAIYPEIYTVKLVEDKLMVKVNGYDNLIPAKVSGDGVVRMISILSCLWFCSGGCLCVDEIDNGLHYSVLFDFWRAVADFVERFNVQLIATTHHLEMLETLNHMVNEKGDADLAAYIRLSHDNEGCHRADVFNGDELDRALQLGLELRG